MAKGYSVPTYVRAMDDAGGLPIVQVTKLADTFVTYVANSNYPALLQEGIIPLVQDDGLFVVNVGQPVNTSHIVWPNVASRQRGHSAISRAAMGGNGHDLMAKWREACGGPKTVEIRTFTLESANKAVAAANAIYAGLVSAIANVASDAADTTPADATPADATPADATPADATPVDPAVFAAAVASSAPKRRK